MTGAGKEFKVPDWGSNSSYPGYGIYGSGHTTDGWQNPLPYIFDTTPSVLKWASTNVPVLADGVTPQQRHSSCRQPVAVELGLEAIGDPSGGQFGTPALGVPCGSTFVGHSYLLL